MRWLALAYAGMLAGCLSTAHRANVDALAPEGTASAWTLSQRGRVHVVIINGNDPFETETLAELRNRLNSNGFAKVSIGGLLFVPLFEHKIRETHRNDPESRFVLIGNGFGAGAADWLAQKLSAEGIAIESIIALAPLPNPLFPWERATDVPRIVIRSAYSLRSYDDQADKVYQIHDSVRAVEDMATAELISQLLMASLQDLPAEPPSPAATLPLIDEPAPRPYSTPVLANPPRVPVPSKLTGAQPR